jgi:hypothetical protein
VGSQSGSGTVARERRLTCTARRRTWVTGGVFSTHHVPQCEQKDVSMANIDIPTFDALMNPVIQALKNRHRLKLCA